MCSPKNHAHMTNTEYCCITYIVVHIWRVVRLFMSYRVSSCSRIDIVWLLSSLSVHQFQRKDACNRHIDCGSVWGFICVNMLCTHAQCLSVFSEQFSLFYIHHRDNTSHNTNTKRSRIEWSLLRATRNGYTLNSLQIKRTSRITQCRRHWSYLNTESSGDAFLFNSKTYMLSSTAQLTVLHREKYPEFMLALRTTQPHVKVNIYAWHRCTTGVVFFIGTHRRRMYKYLHISNGRNVERNYAASHRAGRLALGACAQFT